MRDWEEDSDDTSYQVTWSVGSGSTDHTSNSNELGDHNLLNPMLELFCHADIGLLMEVLVDDMVLAMVALSCHFALDVLCDKSEPRSIDVVTFREPEDEEEMEVEGPIVDGTDLDTFLRDTASQRVRDVRAFQDAVVASLRQDPFFDGETSQLSELADETSGGNPEPRAPAGFDFDGVDKFPSEDPGSSELAVEMGVGGE